MKRSLTLLLPLALLLWSACGDDPAAPAPFSVTIRVVDVDGRPVPGLEVALENAIDPLPEALQPGPGAKSATRIEFVLPLACEVDLEVVDVRGDHVRNLTVGETHVAGEHMLIWDGHGDLGAPVPPGYFEVRMTARQDGAVIFADTTDMYAFLYDVDQIGVGVTGADGTLTLDDPRRFPGLAELGELPMVDDDGELLGAFTVLNAVDVVIGDRDGGLWMPRARLPYGDGANVLELVWDPQARAVEAAGTGEAVRAPIPTPRLPGDPMPDFALRHPYPNPFN
ncbi:MAG TPA: FlgD immunoglobulin-like domain containing protein [Candidatus Krumholzibacteria bacterium]|nr:FlgD immunoglobulin-like domain containing protein [Candidatus Krumholzibacteria bacterium]HRX52610.1 FlgD immunoglobulin-like domain containing protein [Candidatus Krumholzibacteria bacterium]